MPELKLKDKARLLNSQPSFESNLVVLLLLPATRGETNLWQLQKSLTSFQTHRETVRHKGRAMSSAKELERYYGIPKRLTINLANYINEFLLSKNQRMPMIGKGIEVLSTNTPLECTMGITVMHHGNYCNGQTCQEHLIVEGFYIASGIKGRQVGWVQARRKSRL